MAKSVRSKSSSSRGGRRKASSPSEISEKAAKSALLQGERPLAERRAAGKRLREAVPREAHGEWSRSRHHPGAVEIVMRSNKGRQQELIPLRMARMIASPFAFYRGAAAVMACDLSRTPVTGIDTLIDGDAHLNNFGLYGTPERDVVFDLNDFDETVIGPWEWDLKRLTASVNLAGRENGLNRRERDAAVRRCSAGYRDNMTRLQSMGVLDTWYLHAYPGVDGPLAEMNAKSKAMSEKAAKKAAAHTNAALLLEVADKQKDGSWRFHEDPPILTRVDAKTHKAVVDSLRAYADTLPRERKFMLRRYHVADVAHRVVGVGSVGTRAYLVLLFGNGDDDPLFLQVKEAIVPAAGPYIGKRLAEFSHEGKRVVIGQRSLQASTDVMLGWTEIDSRPFYVRQMKNMKGSIPLEWLSGSTFAFYAHGCGALLARAHARAVDAAPIAAYCGKSRVLDDAMALWAEAYADQTELDHAALVKAVKNDRRVQALVAPAAPRLLV